MSELHKFLFEGMPVRGALVRLTDTWVEILRRRSSNTQTGPYPAPVRLLLGEMAAAGALMQSNIKFDGSLTLQVQGDGPVPLAVVEVQADGGLRATAAVKGAVADDATLAAMLNVRGQGRCAITLEPRTRLPGQQAYQGVVPLQDMDGKDLDSVSAMLEFYMRHSEQLDTTLMLAADAQVAVGLLLQRLPVQGEGNLDAKGDADSLHEHYNRLSILAKSLQRQELLTLDAPSILHRLFWDEPLRVFEPLVGAQGPRFACSCSRARVAKMVLALGAGEVQALLSERGSVEVGCEFCGAQYPFDAVDVAQLFTQASPQMPPPPGRH